MAATPPGFLGSQYPTPTDPSNYLNQVGLTSLQPQAFNSDTLSAMFSPQGMQYTPQANLATNPFLELFMKSSEQGTHTQKQKVPGMQDPTQGNPDPRNQMQMGY